MSREEVSEEVTRVVTLVVHRATVTCDGCGGTWTPEELEDADEDSPHEIELVFDGDQCVSERHQLDYCAPCAEERWAALCALVGVVSEVLPVDVDQVVK